MIKNRQFTLESEPHQTMFDLLAIFGISYSPSPYSETTHQKFSGIALFDVVQKKWLVNNAFRRGFLILKDNEIGSQQMASMRLLTNFELPSNKLQECTVMILTRGMFFSPK